MLSDTRPGDACIPALRSPAAGGRRRCDAASVRGIRALRDVRRGRDGGGALRAGDARSATTPPRTSCAAAGASGGASRPSCWPRAPTTSARPTPTTRPRRRASRLPLPPGLRRSRARAPRAAAGRADHRLREPVAARSGARRAHRRARVPRREPQAYPAVAARGDAPLRTVRRAGACRSRPASRTSATAAAVSSPSIPTVRRASRGPARNTTQPCCSTPTRVFHGVDRVAETAPMPPRRAGQRAAFDATAVALVPTQPELARYDWEDLRFSVSWKAYCFADERERASGASARGRPPAGSDPRAPRARSARARPTLRPAPRPARLRAPADRGVHRVSGSGSRDGPRELNDRTRGAQLFSFRGPFLLLLDAVEGLDAEALRALERARRAGRARRFGVARGSSGSRTAHGVALGAIGGDPRAGTRRAARRAPPAARRRPGRRRRSRSAWIAASLAALRTQPGLAARRSSAARTSLRAARADSGSRASSASSRRARSSIGEIVVARARGWRSRSIAAIASSSPNSAAASAAPNTSRRSSRMRWNLRSSSQRRSRSAANSSPARTR